MKTFVNYIKDHFRTDFNWKTHLLIGLFLGVCVSLNYLFAFGEQNRFYDSMLHINYKSLSSVVLLFLFYSFAFLGSIVIISITTKKNTLWNKKYIIFGLIGLLFLSLDSSYYLMKFTDSWYAHNPFFHGWLHACISNLSSLVTVIIPLYILYFMTNTFRPELYGFKLNGAKVKPYFWLILFMIPLIYIASFRPDFLDSYPTYVDRFEYDFSSFEQWQTVGIYEACYGFDFISVELFFRGFLVVALSKIVGKEAILPMVVVYCFLHFGKPAGETISSIFGGYILGILAFSSRNIFGGLIAHLGVAWGMEYLAYLQS
jgi:hypothetical protein